jgi:hypothetical protein
MGGPSRSACSPQFEIIEMAFSGASPQAVFNLDLGYSSEDDALLDWEQYAGTAHVGSGWLCAAAPLLTAPCVLQG